MNLVGLLSPPGEDDREPLLPVPALFEVALEPAVEDHGDLLGTVLPVGCQPRQQRRPSGLQFPGVQFLQLRGLADQVVAIDNEMQGHMLRLAE